MRWRFTARPKVGMVWKAITDFGDTAALGPAIVAVFLWLLANRQWRRALLWFALVGGVAFLVAATKIAFLGWDIGISAIDFTGISGHSALSTLVIPTVGFIAADYLAPRTRGLVLGLAIVASMVICFSRLVLGVHSVSEVIFGYLLGGLSATIFITAWRARRTGLTVSPALLAGVVVVILAVVHGQRAPSDQMMTAIALQLSGREKPFVRPPLVPLDPGRLLMSPHGRQSPAAGFLDARPPPNIGALASLWPAKAILLA